MFLLRSRYFCLLVIFRVWLSCIILRRVGVVFSRSVFFIILFSIGVWCRVLILKLKDCLVFSLVFFRIRVVFFFIVRMVFGCFRRNRRV